MTMHEKRTREAEEFDKETGDEDNDVVIDRDGAPEGALDSLADEEIEPGAAPEQIKKLRKKLGVCIKEKQEYLLGWQRAKADFANARREDEERRKLTARFAAEDIVEDILPVLESFDRAFENREAWESVEKNWRIGVEYIYGQLLDTLKRHGLSVLDPVGEKFDPALHASFETVPAATPQDDHKIVAVLRKGYILREKVLKPPSVRVAIWGGDKPAAAGDTAGV